MHPPNIFQPSPRKKNIRTPPPPPPGKKFKDMTVVTYHSRYILTAAYPKTIPGAPPPPIEIEKQKKKKKKKGSSEQILSYFSYILLLF